jgi:hypothetical protein
LNRAIEKTHYFAPDSATASVRASKKRGYLIPDTKQGAIPISPGTTAGAMAQSVGTVGLRHSAIAI